jgi:hypothetical protein
MDGDDRDVLQSSIPGILLRRSFVHCYNRFLGSVLQANETGRPARKVRIRSVMSHHVGNMHE